MFGRRVGIDSEAPGGIRSDAVGLWKTERIVIGDEDSVSQDLGRHGLAIADHTSQLPGSRQKRVISLAAADCAGDSLALLFAQPALIVAATTIARIDGVSIMISYQQWLLGESSAHRWRVKFFALSN